jgi:peptide deformylase
MLKERFESKEEFIAYTLEQQIRMNNKCLTCSEREQLKKMLDKNYKPTFIKEEKPKLPIVTDINELRKSCKEVTQEDNIKEIIQKLKDTLIGYNGYGLSANQIGIQKKISFCKLPKYDPKDKKLEFTEIVIINPKIIEKDRRIVVKQEGCLSIPYITVDTDRYVFITVEYQDEKLEKRTALFQDLESFILQHEIDHLNGKTIFDRKHQNIDKRR